MTPTENFAAKLKAFANAASDLEDAWDEIDGRIIIEEYPFKEQLYYVALANIRKWALQLAKKF